MTTKTPKPTSPRRLTRHFSTCDITAMPDLLSVLMANIEDGLMQSGAVPGTDYTYRDLANWAMPLLQDVWRDGKLTYIIDNPIDGD